MIDEYLREKENKIKLEKLLAWKEFYEQCGNMPKVFSISHYIERFKSRLCG